MTTYSVDFAGTGETSPTIPGKSTISLPRNTINSSSTSIRLTGQSVPNYGEIQQENFIQIMEHFASKNAPDNPTVGQIWYDTVNTRAWIYDITEEWKTIFPAAFYSATAPTDPRAGDLWFDTTNVELNVYSGSAWVLGSQKKIQFKNEGTNLGTAGTVTAIDFVGAGITATRSTDTLTVTVTGTGSGTTGYVTDIDDFSITQATPSSPISYETTDGGFSADTGTCYTTFEILSDGYFSQNPSGHIAFVSRYSTPGGDNNGVGMTFGNVIPTSTNEASTNYPTSLMEEFSAGAVPGIVSITRVGTTATLTLDAAHNLETGASITISGATPSQYNGTFTATITGPTTLTYTMGSDPGSSATVVGTFYYRRRYLFPGTDLPRGIFLEDDVKYKVEFWSKKTIDGYCTARYRLSRQAEYKYDWDILKDTGELVVNKDDVIDFTATDIGFAHVFAEVGPTWTVDFTNIQVVWSSNEVSLPDMSQSVSRLGGEIIGVLDFSQADDVQIHVKSGGVNFEDWTKVKNSTTNGNTSLLIVPNGTSTNANVVCTNDSDADGVFGTVSFGMSGANALIETYPVNGYATINLNVTINDSVATGTHQFTNKGLWLQSNLATGRALGDPSAKMRGIYNGGNSAAAGFGLSSISPFDLNNVCSVGQIQTYLTGSGITAATLETMYRPLYCMVANIIKEMRELKILQGADLGTGFD